MFENSFLVKILAENPCGPSLSVVAPIYISTPAIAQYTLPSENFCTNSSISLNNTSIDGTQASQFGCAPTKVLWSVSPNTGFSFDGKLGSDNGHPDTPKEWTGGSHDLSLTFSEPGSYTITMNNAGTCNNSVYTKTICVTPPLVPKFTVDKSSACVDETVTTTNTTDISNRCSTPNLFLDGSLCCWIRWFFLFLFICQWNKFGVKRAIIYFPQGWKLYH